MHDADPGRTFDKTFCRKRGDTHLAQVCRFEIRGAFSGAECLLLILR